MQTFTENQGNNLGACTGEQITIIDSPSLLAVVLINGDVTDVVPMPSVRLNEDFTVWIPEFESSVLQVSGVVRTIVQ